MFCRCDEGTTESATYLGKDLALISEQTGADDQARIEAVSGDTLRTFRCRQSFL